MPRVYVEFAGLKETGDECKTVSARIDSIQSDFQRTVKQLDWDVKYEGDINNTANRIARSLERYSQALRNYQNFINEAYAEYSKLEQKKGFNADSLISTMSVIPNIAPIVGPGGQMDIGDVEKDFWEKISEGFKEEFGWKELLAGAGYIGTIYNLVTGIKDGKTWADFGKSGKEVYDFISDAAKTYNNYRKIGNAVGTKTAMTWWAKNITGVKSLGRASTAKNPITRFANNLTNKTSPFNAQIKNTLKDFKGGNGVGKAIASWGAVAVTGIANAFGNIKEQKESNGTMSTGRVVAETITETAIDTVLTYGAGAVVGAAVTAALGTVAAPGVLVVAASGAIVAGVNAGVKALTGKTTTEWLSDTILDTGEAIGKAVGNAANNIKQSVGNWFGKLAFG